MTSCKLNSQLIAQMHGTRPHAQALERAAAAGARVGRGRRRLPPWWVVDGKGRAAAICPSLGSMGGGDCRAGRDPARDLTSPGARGRDQGRQRGLARGPWRVRWMCPTGGVPRWARVRVVPAGETQSGWEKLPGICHPAEARATHIQQLHSEPRLGSVERVRGFLRTAWR